MRVERIYLTRATWPLRLAFLATAMAAIGGCMSSPGDQLASVQTLPAPVKVTDSANFDARHDGDPLKAGAETTGEATNDPSAIAMQAARDAALLNRQAQVANAPDMDAVDAGHDGERNISATQNSIFSAASSVKSGRLVADASSVDGVQGQMPGMNASEGSIYSAQIDPAARDAAAIPLPDADKVGVVQDLALAGMEIPPELATAASEARPEVVPDDTKTVAIVPRTRSLGAIEPDVTSETSVEKPAANPKKRRLTLADFFRRKTETAAFDDTRFGKQKKTRSLTTSAIPNMKTASLTGDALPGVETANAMLSVDNTSEEHAEEGDEPAGLMKLASLSGMARIAPNGLWLQTDKVAISCLRPQLVSMLKAVEKHYGRPVVVTSGFRDGRHNRRAGGARHSLHTLCAAADIQIEGVTKAELADYLRSVPGRGGVGTYCHTQSVHIDIGEERDWNWRCRRTKRRG